MRHDDEFTWIKAAINVILGIAVIGVAAAVIIGIHFLAKVW